MPKIHPNNECVTVAGEEYGTAQLASIFGASLRQLQWWDEWKLLSVRHEGHTRRYSRENAILVGVIVALRKSGFSLQRVRRVVRSLERQLISQTPRFVVVAHGYRRDELLYACDEPSALSVLREVARAGKFTLLIDLREINDRLTERGSKRMGTAARPQSLPTLEEMRHVSAG